MPGPYFLLPAAENAAPTFDMDDGTQCVLVHSSALYTTWRFAPAWWRVWLLGLYAPDLVTARTALRVLAAAIGQTPTERGERTDAETEALRQLEAWLAVGTQPDPEAMTAAAAARAERERAAVADGRQPATPYARKLSAFQWLCARLAGAMEPATFALKRRGICRAVAVEVASLLQLFPPAGTYAGRMLPFPPTALLDGHRPEVLGPALARLATPTASATPKD